MKRLLLLALCLCISLTAVHAQKGNKVDRFINEYKTFVDEVVATPYADFHGDTLNRMKRQQRCFMRRYRWYYKSRMSEEQLEQFNRLCGRYHKKKSRLQSRRRLAVLRGRVKGRFENIFKTDTISSDTIQFDTLPIQEY